MVFGILSGADAEMRFIGIIISGAAWGVGEIVYSIGAAARTLARGWIFLILTLVFLLAAMIFWMIWNPDISGAATCRQFQNFPGHAIFHILAAFGALFAFLSFQSEEPR